VLATTVVLAIAMGVSSVGGGAATARAATPDAAQPAPPSTIPALGSRWFALGANVPYIRWRCDFGCGAGGGVRGNEVAAERILRTMSRRGVRVVRWYLFPGDAWQIGRTADGTPTQVSAGSLADLDEALHLAEKYDVYLLPVVLPSPSGVPATWFTDPAQAAALAGALRPMFARYAKRPNLLAWELATGAEALTDQGIATREQLYAHVGALQGALNSAAPQLSSVGPLDVSRIDSWTGVGVDFYAPQYLSSMPGDQCAACRSVDDLAAREGLDRPVIVGGYDATTPFLASRRLAEFARLGYAGALTWSWRGTEHPQRPGSALPASSDGTWQWEQSHANAGPHARPRNPCYGPKAGAYRCPNLQMSTPRDISLGRRGKRAILYSTNSVNSVGAGPASIRGTRSGRFTMDAKQLLHRTQGGAPLVINTDAKLAFKAVPGQYRYWKWTGAARMELWRLNAAGVPVERTRIGPKTVYCLRDLKRTRGWLPRSPRGQVYPGCSQSLTRQAVTLGTSVGWSDRYPASYNENWVDVTGLRGCFAYVHVADPTNAIYESNEDDNTSKVVVRLPFRGSNAGCPGAKALPVSGTTGIY